MPSTRIIRRNIDAMGEVEYHRCTQSREKNAVTNAKDWIFFFVAVVVDVWLHKKTRARSQRRSTSRTIVRFCDWGAGRSQLLGGVDIKSTPHWELDGHAILQRSEVLPTTEARHVGSRAAGLYEHTRQRQRGNGGGGSSHTVVGRVGRGGERLTIRWGRRRQLGMSITKTNTSPEILVNITRADGGWAGRQYLPRLDLRRREGCIGMPPGFWAS